MIVIRRLKIFVFVLGAVFACAAPFTHIIYPKLHENFSKYDNLLEKGEISNNEYTVLVEKLEFEEKIFGFDNKRKFWFAIGKPISMLYFSLVFLYLSQFIKVKSDLEKAVKLIVVLYLFISLYFIIWTFWHRKDFPKHLYYIGIGVGSVFGTLISKFLLTPRQIMIKNVHSLLRFIVIDIKNKYISNKDKSDFVNDYTTEIEKLKS